MKGRYRPVLNTVQSPKIPDFSCIISLLSRPDSIGPSGNTGFVIPLYWILRSCRRMIWGDDYMNRRPGEGFSQALLFPSFLLKTKKKEHLSIRITLYVTDRTPTTLHPSVSHRDNKLKPFVRIATSISSEYWFVPK